MGRGTEMHTDRFFVFIVAHAEPAPGVEPENSCLQDKRSATGASRAV